ncbi:MAG: NUDIX domain-containing protein [Anaerolineae bacterium]
MIDESWYRRPPDTPGRISAGGVVTRLAGGQVQIALVCELPFAEYILPKGRLEPGESIEEAARREIAEEAGLADLRLVAYLGSRQRLSYDKRSWITAHYYLFVTEQVDGRPTDTEHDYRLAWFPIEALPPMFWPEQRELIESNRERIVASVRQTYQ